PARSMHCPYATLFRSMTITGERKDGMLELEVVDLSSGRVRWARSVGSDQVPPVAVGAGTVVFAENSQLTSYNDRTGQVRWTEALDRKSTRLNSSHQII